MPSHYGVSLIPDAHKNAINVVFALLIGDNPAIAENLSVPANVTGSPDDDFTYWLGGMPFTEARLAVFHNIGANIPAVSWPVGGIDGPVALVDAQAACTAFIFSATTRETYTTQQAQDTLNAILTTLGLKRVVFD